MNTKHINFRAAVALLPSVLVACGGGGGDDASGPLPSPPPPPSAQFSTIVDIDSPAANAINGIAYASDNSMYAIGYTNDADPMSVVLAYNADGSPNTSFGTNGVLTLNVKAAGATGDSGNEQPFGIVLLADGDLLFVVDAADGNGTATVTEGQSVYLVRLDSANGFAVVDDFGDEGGVNGLLAGVQEVVFGWTNTSNGAFPSATAGFFPTDSAQDLVLDTRGGVERVVVNGIGTAASGQMNGGVQATDNDRFVTRLLASDGTVDSTFNGGAAFTFSTPRGENSGDNGRHASVEADGSIMSAGYTDLGGDLGNHIVLIRLLADGSLDSSFGNFIFPADGPAGVAAPGIAVFNPFRDAGGFAESYAAVAQSNGDYVTTGYGRANGGTAPASGPLSSYDDTDEQDVVTFRVAGGSAIDLTYGNPAEPGTQAIQSEGVDFADAEEISTEERGRNMVVLPDDRTVQVGYYGGVPALYVFTADGQLDTSVDDDGLILLPHTPVTTGSPVTQQFFTAELSPDGTRLAVGTRGDDPAGSRVVVLNVAP